MGQNGHENGQNGQDGQNGHKNGQNGHKLTNKIDGRNGQKMVKRTENGKMDLKASFNLISIAN